MKTMQFKEGFYHMTCDGDPDPVLVHGYICADENNEFVFGFNTYDGGGLIPLKDVSAGTKITPVKISEDKI